MSRILAYTSPARGHLFPVSAILEELRARGHDVVLRTLATEVPRMRERGFDAAAIDPGIEAIEHTDWQTKGSVAGLQRAVGVFARRAALDAPDLRAAIDAVRPDAVIVDINAWGAMATAEAWGGPWATFCPYPLAVASADAPPYGPGLPPARGPIGRLRDRVLRPVVMGSVERVMAPPLNAVRTAVGVRPSQGRTTSSAARPCSST